MKRYGSLGLTVSTPGRRPVAVAEGDYRLTPRGMAEFVLGGFLRMGVTLERADQSTWGTSLAEYVVPDLILMEPSPHIVVMWNRVLMDPYVSDVDPGEDIPAAAFWAFRYTDQTTGDVEQRIRVGSHVDTAAPWIFAVLYVKDFTQ